MDLKVLVENSVNKNIKGLKAAHGLSLYLETDSRKILVDLGSTDLFLENAKRLGVSIEDVDTLVISHGHIDHIGGLKHFLKNNSRGKVYIHRDCRKRLSSKLLGLFHIDIGGDRELFKKYSNRFVFIDGDYNIDENHILLSNFDTFMETPTSNRVLYSGEKGDRAQDSFNHEIALIVRDNGRDYLISSCSHSGIYNIIKTGINRYSLNFKGVVGGFHLYNPVSWKREKDQYIHDLGNKLESLGDINFYTCHCTGSKSIKRLKDILGERVRAISTGDSLNF